MLQRSNDAKAQLQSYQVLFAKYLRPQWSWVLLLTVLILGSITIQLVNPQIMRGFIDTAQAGGSSEVLLRAALLFLVLALVQQIVSVLAAYVSENVAWTATNALRADLAEHCLRLDMSFHNAHAPRRRSPHECHGLRDRAGSTSGKVFVVRYAFAGIVGTQQSVDSEHRFAGCMGVIAESLQRRFGGCLRSDRFRTFRATSWHRIDRRHADQHVTRKDFLCCFLR